MLLRFGVTYQDFDRVCKAAFIGVAIDEYGIAGKPASVSRVSLMTGLTRKVVRRVQEQKLQASLPKPELRSLPAEVLNVWHKDPQFCDTKGQPNALTWDSSSGSFCELVRKCSGSVSPATMRDELLRVGAMAESKGGLFVAKRRSFVPATTEERLIQGLQYGLRPLAMTVAHNTTTDEPRNLRFQRIVWNYCLPKEKRVAVDAFITQRLEEFSQEIDDV
ncbi:MAG: DUF6502 family protein, partial [Gammaproteobacteria bacterium]|nr:DUF6502 family protein [Gammaproteobacteria bacterium]